MGNLAEILDEIKTFSDDLSFYGHSIAIEASSEINFIIGFLENTQNILVKYEDYYLTISSKDDLGFKFELSFDMTDCVDFGVKKQLNIADLRLSFNTSSEALEYFCYLIDKKYDQLNTIKLKNILVKSELEDLDERHFVEQILRSRKLSDDWVDNVSLNEVAKWFGEACWLRTSVENGALIITPDPGFGHSVTIHYDGEVFLLRNKSTNPEDYNDITALPILRAKLLKFLNVEYYRNALRRCSIYEKLVSESKENLMDMILDNNFYDSEEQCFVELLLREGGVSDKWFKKVAKGKKAESDILLGRYFHEYEGLSLTTLTSVLCCFFPLFTGSLAALFLQFFSNTNTLFDSWQYIGLFFASLHLILVFLVARLCFIFLFLDNRQYEYGGIIPHKAGWLIVATSFFPFGWLVGLVIKINGDYLTNRINSGFEVLSNQRVVYEFIDLLGLIPFCRLWIPTLLFGISGVIFWYYLPYIY